MLTVEIIDVTTKVWKPLPEAGRSIEAYRAFFDGDEAMAMLLLEQEHYDDFWFGNDTTTKYLAGVYQDHGRQMPMAQGRVDETQVDKDLLQEALRRRANDHLAVAADIRANGIRNPVQLTLVHGVLRVRDGYNRMCVATALGLTQVKAVMV